MERNTKAHLAVMGANIIFAISYSVVKYLSPGVMHPYALNAVRILVSLVFFWGLFALKPGRAGIDRKDIPRFIGCAITGAMINQLMFIKGVSLTTPIHSSLLSLCTPIFITFIAAWLIKEMLSWLKILGLVFGVSGSLLLILTKEQQTVAGSNIILGDIMVMINAISYAFYLVMVRPLMAKYSAIHVLRWVFTFGTVLILPFTLGDFVATDWAAFGLGHWVALTFIAIGATCLAYLFNVYGISVIGPSATGTYIYTQPIFAAIIAILFAGEHVSWIKLLAAACIFTGVFLANYKRSVPETVVED